MPACRLVYVPSHQPICYLDLYLTFTHLLFQLFGCLPTFSPAYQQTAAPDQLWSIALRSAAK
eukprot:6211493-Pleurochrysis_carterae.AAC.2